MNYNQVQDSGNRRTFSTGAVRDMLQGKGRFDLIPPTMLKRLAKHYENGAVKYNDRNWEQGIPISSLIDSAFRHLICYMQGGQEEDHLAAVIWNISAIIHFEEQPDNLDLFNLPWQEEAKKHYDRT